MCLTEESLSSSITCLSYSVQRVQFVKSLTTGLPISAQTLEVHSAICVKFLLSPGYGRSVRVQVADRVEFVRDLISEFGLNWPVLVTPSMSGSYALPFVFRANPPHITALVTLAPVFTAEFTRQQYKGFMVCRPNAWIDLLINSSDCKYSQSFDLWYTNKSFWNTSLLTSWKSGAMRVLFIRWYLPWEKRNRNIVQARPP